MTTVSFYADHGDSLHRGPGVCERMVGGMGAAYDAEQARIMLRNRDARACECLITDGGAYAYLTVGARVFTLGDPVAALAAAAADQS